MSATNNRPRRSFLLRRGPMENIATAVIAIGFLMLFQPFWLGLECLRAFQDLHCSEPQVNLTGVLCGPQDLGCRARFHEV